MHDIVIIGSGPSGVAAALSLAGLGIVPTMIDVGVLPPALSPVKENFYDYAEKHDTYSLLIGTDFEGLRNLDRTRSKIPAKLTAPKFRFVAAGVNGIPAVHMHDYHLIQSFAKGGLAGAWGAGLYRYTNRDLKGFPVKEADLTPYFDRLSREIGISGEDDDLAPFFGRDAFLMPPLKISANAAALLHTYSRKKERLRRMGAYLGRPRLGVLSEEKQGRRPCDYRNLEFWEPGLPYIYTPDVTLNRLIDEKKIVYKPGFFAERWERKKNQLAVRLKNLKNGTEDVMSCRMLILAAGAVNSGRLALSSKNDHQTRLTLLDNPAHLIPFILPRRVGCRLEKEAFGLTQLNLVYDRAQDRQLYQGSLLEVTSPSRAELFESLPLAARSNFTLIRDLIPALLVMQLFSPGSSANGAALSLLPSDELEIIGPKGKKDTKLMHEILSIMRKLGAFSHPSLVEDAPPGHGIHYGGTLPMAEKPNGSYTCSRNGELADEPGIYVVDGSLFPVLPAKNFSLTVMANAMRIAEHVGRLFLKETE